MGVLVARKTNQMIVDLVDQLLSKVEPDFGSIWKHRVTRMETLSYIKTSGRFSYEKDCLVLVDVTTSVKTPYGVSGLHGSQMKKQLKKHLNGEPIEWWDRVSKDADNDFIQTEQFKFF